MSVMAETSHSAMGPYVTSAEATSALYAWTAAFSATLVVKMPGGDDGGEGGEGGDGGDGGGRGCGGGGGEGFGGGGGCEGGEGGEGGESGGLGGWNCTTKDLFPWSPSAKNKLCPKPGAAHSAPFQPSPYSSVMSRVHVAPSATANGTLEVYGAHSLSVVPSEQMRLQPTSSGSSPSEQVIAEEIDGAAGGEGGGDGGDGRDGGWNCTTKDSPRSPNSCSQSETKETLCPKPGAAHTAPFPSPQKHAMLKVHVVPSATTSGKLKA